MKQIYDKYRVRTDVNDTKYMTLNR